jgi:large subunit ribosomal protein L13
MKTTVTHPDDVDRQWHIVDAEGKPAGRLAARVAHVLRGKIKPSYTPHVDAGDFVVIINADKVKLTGRKDELKTYKNYTGFPGGLKEVSAEVVRARKPTRIVEQAVRGMMPKNKQCDRAMKRLKVYAGAEHPHAAQQPKPLSL